MFQNTPFNILVTNDLDRLFSVKLRSIKTKSDYTFEEFDTIVMVYFIVAGSKWRVTDLTYRISKYPRRLKDRQKVDKEIAKAFKVSNHFISLIPSPIRNNKQKIRQQLISMSIYVANFFFLSSYPWVESVV